MLIDEISKIVANKLRLSELEVTQINRSQFKFLLETMQSGEMKGVSIFYLGKFVKNAKYKDHDNKLESVSRCDK